MQKFIIKSIHDVYIDNFETGEGDHVNYYTGSYTIEAETIREAIKKYFESVLFYSFDFDDANIDGTMLTYSVLVDVDNEEVKEGSEDFIQWKDGHKTLYSNNITILAERVVPLNLEMLTMSFNLINNDLLLGDDEVCARLYSYDNGQIIKFITVENTSGKTKYYKATKKISNLNDTEKSEVLKYILGAQYDPSEILSASDLFIHGKFIKECDKFTNYQLKN